VETPPKGIRLGAFDYLSKPFESIENVWSAVRRALQKRAIELDREALLARLQADPAEV
jgi:DNA-binding NtrC family response regulator